MKTYFTYGRATRWDGKDKIVQHRYGYNWFLWVPLLRIRFKNYGIYVDTSWFIYWWSMFLSYRTPEQTQGQNSLTPSSP